MKKYLKNKAPGKPGLLKVKTLKELLYAAIRGPVLGKHRGLGAKRSFGSICILAITTPIGHVIAESATEN